MPSGEKLVTHGMSRDPEYRAEYAAWKNMKQRCYNPNNDQFCDYGGRGITVSKEWISSFETFLEDVGRKPRPEHLYSLDRIDNDGNYEFGNVKWATFFEQSSNRRKQARIENFTDDELLKEIRRRGLVNCMEVA